MNVYFVCVGNRPHAKHVVSSFKRNMDCNVVQITDNATPEIPGIDHVIRRNSYKGKKHMMHFMIESFSKIKDSQFITTADDCIIQKPFGEILDGDYDVAICKRIKPKKNGSDINFIPQVPYTNGLVVVKHPGFYKDCLRRLEWLANKDKHFLEWWGDMASIRIAIEAGNYKVKELPEDDYCRIPEVVGEGDDSAVLWHYAGDRKWWMDYHGKGVADGTRVEGSRQTEDVVRDAPGDVRPHSEDAEVDRGVLQDGERILEHHAACAGGNP